ncbi:lytic transglycosylase domain-containing protein [Rhodoflexus caldus]|uniref:lytic transglycosylase domain-containing protein n=1 Tax=Rhodoflexus caldus TaxID=2891236 RepID=UPI00202A2662|nr:lytic transglycosylase domain-containing protein [Rhodoflexus caldus]
MLFGAKFLLGVGSVCTILFLGSGSLLMSDSSEKSNVMGTDSLKTVKKQYISTFPLPEQLTFAGEQVPMNDPDVRERIERELIQNSYKHSATILILKREGRWRKEISRILKEEGVPEDFFYLAVAESELDEHAQSGVGAVGFWQFMKTTAPSYNLEVSEYVDMRKDPIASTYAACRYLKDAYKRFGNWTLAAASYNRGVTGLDNAVKAQKVSNFYDLYLNRETYRYVMRIIALKLIIENPQAYGFFVEDADKYQPLDGVRTVTIDSTINDLPQFALDMGINYKILKIYNPWINSSDYKLVVPKGKTYTITLPESAVVSSGK